MKGKRIMMICGAVIALAVVIWISAWTSQFMPSSGIRSGQELKTAVATFSNKNSGRRVVVICASHIGTRDYYTQMQSVITNGPSLVLFEGWGLETAEERAAMSEKELSVLRVFRSRSAATKARAAAIGGVIQREGLKYQNQWVNSDMRIAEIVRNIAGRIAKDMPAPTEPTITETAVKAELKYLPQALFIGKLVVKVFGVRKAELETIEGERNQKLLAILDSKLASGQDCTEIWGAAHFPAIREHLLANGFSEVSRQWLTVYMQ